MILNYKHFNKIRYTKQCFVTSHMQNKSSLNYFMRQSAKIALIKRKNATIAHNFKNMTIIFISNNFKTKIYFKWCCVPSFMQKEPCLNYFMRKCQKSFKNGKKTNLARNFKHMTIVINFCHSKPIINTKQCCVPSIM